MVKRFGLVVQPLAEIEHGEVVKREGDVGVTRAQGGLAEGERALVKRLGPAIQSLESV